jgi:hypothetical protein
MIMSAYEDQLKAERRSLERSQRHYKAHLPEWKRKLEAARENARLNGKFGQKNLDEVQSQFDLWKGIHDQGEERSRQKIAELEGKINQQAAETHEKARAALEAEKQKALQKWIEEGGTNESFASVWPTMEIEILKMRILGSNNQADLIQKKRAQLRAL